VSVRAGIVVTGTEVLTGRVADRNGPWLAERLEEQGVDVACTTIVGDRRADMEAALRFMAQQGLDVIVTSGGLGPTADDLTAEVVGGVQGRGPVWDEALHGRIEAIVKPLAERWKHVDTAALEAGTRKQATIPAGATVLDPIGTAPGLVVPPAPSEEGPAERQGPPPPSRKAPTVIVLPGPPGELRPMWEAAILRGAFTEAFAGAVDYTWRTLRLWGIPESEIAETLRLASRNGIPLEHLEITTCLKRGELEIVTRFEPPAEAAYSALAALVKKRHGEMLFSEDGSTVDDLVAALLRGAPGSRRERGDGGGEPLTIATAESCTGGLLAARLTERAGASDYVRGGVVAYSNEAKESLAGVDPELIERHGAVSSEVAEALASGARAGLGADVGVGITGIAGPSGATAEKPVGLVCLSVAGPGDAALTRSVTLPGSRADLRERAVTVALHMVRRALSGARPGGPDVEAQPTE
jgi:nicotinamide-nucleotide amidase